MVHRWAPLESLQPWKQLSFVHLQAQMQAVTLFALCQDMLAFLSPSLWVGNMGVEAASVSVQAVASTWAILAGVPRLLVGAWSSGTASCNPTVGLLAAAQPRDAG